MNETKNSKFKKRAAALAVASCLSFSPWIAEAAGLGKLTVLSGLGQPLRAELDIGAAKDEMTGMTARLAPQEAFRRAGVDFSSVLLDLRFAVEKRPSGQSVVKVTSAKPINEPFLDFLIELNWPTGRLVREYTFLLDPPEIAATQTSRTVAEARVVDTVRGGTSAGETWSAPGRGGARSAPIPKTAGEHVVKPGETLRKIAGENQYDGVSLEQMLVALFQNNPDAFMAKNVNRLKAGAILNMPEKAVVEAVSPAEAKKVYVTHAGDWHAYRQKLAAATAKAPAKDETLAAQSASGKITAKVEDKPSAAEQGKDQVKVARTDAPGKAAETANLVAKDQALKEAQDRLQVLEKNVNELQKLLEMKNQKLAELQQLQARKDEPKGVAPAPVESPKAPEAEKPAEPAKAVEPPPVSPSKPAETKAPEAPKPAKPKVVPPSPPPEEPGFVDALLQDPLPLAGGAAALALLAYLLKRRRRQDSSAETTALPVPSSLGPNSVFRMTGGQSIDTGNTPPQTGDFSQTGPGTIDTDEVDPVAEADVYMAYGRDTQAEEILLEALQKDPQRTAIHVKLLEVYANRRSVKQFETLAGELYAQTAGVGPDWEKAAALGLGLDPQNPLYSASRPQESPAARSSVERAALLTPASSVALEAEPAQERSIPGLSKDFEQDTTALSKAVESQVQAHDATVSQDMDTASDAMTLDFDLGAETIAPGFTDENVGESSADTDAAENALDFDFAGDDKLPEEVLGDDGLDFDLDVNDGSLLEATKGVAHDFSPEGTLITPSSARANEGDTGRVSLSLDAGKAETGISAAESAPPLRESAISQTASDESIGVDTVVDADALNFDAHAADTKPAVGGAGPGELDPGSLDFDVELTDSMVLGQPMGASDFEIGSISLDLAEPPATADFGEETIVLAEPPAFDEPPMMASPLVEPLRNEHWEEVNTKLDLAKAYEEMGDLEGARELLREVVGDGPVDLVEQARTILGRIGE